MINVFQPTLGKEELERLEKVFASNWIGKGKLVSEFEEIYAQHLGSTRIEFSRQTAVAKDYSPPCIFLIFSQVMKLFFQLLVLLVRVMQCVPMDPEWSFVMLISIH